MSVDKKNFYDRLGLPRDATDEQIKEAYREIARIYHPDSNFFDDILEEVSIDSSLSERDLEMFRMVTEAYNTLINEAKRKKYDEMLIATTAGWRSPGAATQKSKPAESKTAAGSLSNAAQIRVRVQEKEESSPPAARVRSVAAMIQEQRAVTTAQNAPADGRRRLQLFAVIGAMVLVVIGAALFFLLR